MSTDRSPDRYPRPKANWNPFSGCEKVSAGCRFCYAEAIATGKRGCGSAFDQRFDLQLRLERMDDPKRLTTPHLIFFGSMSDLFWEDVPPNVVERVIQVIEDTPRHIFMVQTKRPERMLAQSQRRPFPPNLWAGVTIENQANAARLDVLRQVNAHVRYLSCEPLLSPLKLDWAAVDWVIVGGETGPHLWQKEHRDQRALVGLTAQGWTPRPDRLDWVRGIRDGCVNAGTPFYLKQWGGPRYAPGSATLDGAVWQQCPPMPQYSPQPALMQGLLPL